MTALLRQSWRSNYCGIYSTAMFLARSRSEPPHRSAAFRLFGLPLRRRAVYAGASLRDIRVVLQRELGASQPRWLRYRSLDSNRLLKRAVRELQTREALLSFDAISHAGLRGAHVVVLVGASETQFSCLDPLGRNRGEGANTAINRTTGEVSGAAYCVDLTGDVWLLALGGG